VPKWLRAAHDAGLRMIDVRCHERLGDFTLMPALLTPAGGTAIFGPLWRANLR